MHADLQAMPMELTAAVTVRHSSKASSLIRAPTLVCLLKSCRNNGMKSSTCTLAALSSGLTAVARSGGHVISAQTAFNTVGRLL